MHFFEQQNGLAYSQIRSTHGHELSKSSAGSYHSLPHVTQPILAKYRLPRPSSELVLEETSSFWCSLFASSRPQALGLCKCERAEEGHCELVVKWVGEYYDWQRDPKFSKAYQGYSRRSIEVFLSDRELGSRLEKKLEILGARLDEQYRELLVRVCRNYLKHTVYYGRAEQLTRENDLWMWFAIGIFYHSGPGSCGEELLFWSVDIVMNSFGSLTRATLHQHIRKMLDLIREYFPNWHNRLVAQYAIDLEPIVYEWANELMMGYMGIEAIGFFVDCLLKAGWSYVYKVVLSYFEKRMERMENEELFASVSDREVVTARLINCDEEWPLIFCNANSFCFDKPAQT